MCETHGGCNPDNYCHTCKCIEDAWLCTNGDCTSDGFLPLGSIGKSEYFFSMRAKRSWNDAEEACETNGGHIAVLKTQNETDELWALLEQAPKFTRNRDIYLGAKSDDAEKEDGHYYWTDGSTVSRDDPRWGWEGQVKPYGEGPHCLVLRPWLWKGYDRWAVTRCRYRGLYICEIPTSVEEAKEETA